MKTYLLIVMCALLSACVGMAFEPWEGEYEARPWGKSFKDRHEKVGDWRDQFGGG